VIGEQSCLSRVIIRGNISSFQSVLLTHQIANGEIPILTGSRLKTILNRYDRLSFFVVSVELFAVSVELFNRIG